LLEELGLSVPLVCKTDSSAALQSSEKVGLLHVKHLSLRMHFLKEVVRAGLVSIVKVASVANLADSWTKPVPVEVLRRLLEQPSWRLLSSS
jgi:hypothetical protein